MSELIKKNEALIRIRNELTRCPISGEPYASVAANSHQATDDPVSRRFYFQFILEDGREFIAFTMAVDFEDWMKDAIAKQQG